MHKTIKAKIQKRDASLEVGTALLEKIVRKYLSKKVILRAASKLNIPVKNDTMILESEMDWLYLMDFALNDLYFRITSKSLNKYDKDKGNLLGLKTNLIERYKHFIGVDSKEESIIDSWISNKLSIFEIVEVDPPLLTVRDLLESNNDNLETIFDRNASRSIMKNMIWAFRLTKFAGLGATSGVSFVFSSDHKIRLLKNWAKIAKKSKSDQKNRLLYVYLFRAQRKYGIEIQSEIFL